MGTDIRGYIEAGLRHRTGTVRWTAIEKLSVIGSYDMFGCLFGVMNYANFRPIAADRGIPPDASKTVKHRVAEILTWAKPDSADFHSATWISWAEIREIDWREEALEADSRLRRYRRTEDGTLVYQTKAGWFGEVATAMGKDLTEVVGRKLVLPDGFEFELGEHVYRAETMQRKDALTIEWMEVFKRMESLAEKYGDGLVRLVVWFDS